MAVLALAVAGAALAPAGYAAVGWFAGQIIGQALFGNKGDGQDQTHEGPRLRDLRVQASTWGVSIPRHEGTFKSAGNVLWTSGRREHVHTETNTVETGGKAGGNSQSVTNTTYSYDIDLAIGLCEGSINGVGSGIIGIRKIWANGNLIYNVGDTASTEDIVASNLSSQNIRVYTGDETQLPDPTIEAFQGSGNVSAHRGLAYVVFTQFQLAPYNDSPPNFEFEVVATGSVANLAKVTRASTGATGSRMHYTAANTISVPASSAINILNGSTGELITQFANIGSGVVGGFPNSTFSLESNNICVDRQGYTWAMTRGPMNGTNGVWLIRLSPSGAIERMVRISNVDPGGGAGGCYGIDSEDTMFVQITGSTLRRIKNILRDEYKWNGTDLTAVVVETYSDLTYTNGALFLGPDGVLYGLNGAIGAFGRFVDGGVQSTMIAGFNTANAFLRGMRWDLSGNMWVAWKGATFMELKRIDSTGAVTQTITLANATTAANLYDFMFAPDGFLWVNDASTWQKRVVSTGAIQNTVTGGATFETGIATPYAVFTNVTGSSFLLEPLPRLTATSTTTLASCIQRLCVATGQLTTGDIDVSGVTEILYGYSRSRPMTARAAIDPLLLSFGYDAVDGEKLRFVKRGGASAVTIPLTDLVRRNDDDPVKLDYTRTDELDAPRQITVNYFNRSAAYMEGTEYGRRLVTRAQQQGFIDLPLSLTPDEAAQVADRLVYAAHVERTKYPRFATSMKYSKYEPTDIFTIPTAAATHVMRVTRKLDRGSMIEWDCVAEYQSVHTSAAVGANIATASNTVNVGGTVELALLDIPIIRNQDDDAGIYGVLSLPSLNGSGSTLYQSPDDAAYVSKGSVSTGAQMGYTATALGTFLGGNTFDEVNVFDITFTNGTPESVTRLEVLNGYNLYLIGDEMVQARDAVFVSGTTYRFSGLLRGRRGTDITAHSAGERVVKLDGSGMIRVTDDISSVGLPRFYKAVAFGGTLPNTPSQVLVHQANGLKPRPPCKLRGIRDPSGNIQITWVRRGRLSWDWNNLQDVPIGEDSEEYVVTVLDSGSVLKRTFSGLTTNTVQYSTGDQTTDFGGNQSSVLIGVYMISAEVGRGYPAFGLV